MGLTAKDCVLAQSDVNDNFTEVLRMNENSGCNEIIAESSGKAVKPT